MQLPPLSSSSYTVIPEKSFHLCHTYTLPNTCARTQKRAHTYTRTRKYTLTHTHFFFLNPLCTFSSPPLSALHDNTTLSYSFQICSSTQLTVQSLSVSAQITFSSFRTVSSFSPWFLQSYVSYSKPPMCPKKTGGEKKLSLVIKDCEFCYPAVVRGYNS